MGKLGKTVSVFALTLTGGLLTSGLGGCSSHDFFKDHKTSEQDPPQSEPSSSLKDAGVAPPFRLDGLITAAKPPPAISGGTLAISRTGDLAVAADSDRDLLYIITILTEEVRTVKLPAGSEPGRVVFDEAGAVHVSLRSSGKVVRVDLSKAAVVAESTACQLPRGLAFDQDQNQLWVACASGELVSLDATSYAETSRLFLELDLRDVVMLKNGVKQVSRYRSAELITIGADGTRLAQKTPQDTLASRFDNVPSDDGSSSSSSKDGNGPVNLGGFESRIVTSSATLAWRTVSASDGTSVMVHQQSQNDEVIIGEAGGYGGGLGGCQPITQGGVTRYDADGNPSAPILLGGAALVVDVAASQDGRWLALAKPGAYLRGENASLEVISTGASSDNAVDGGVFPGLPTSAPIFLDAGVVTPGDDPQPSFDGGVPFPSQSPSQCNTGWGQGFDVQTTAVAFDFQGNLYAFSREPAQLTIYRSLNRGNSFDTFPSLDLDVSISLNSTSVRDTGHELFHADVGTGLACASCHGEALDDGHVWNFRDFGPRRTQNMRGGLLQTLPLHWEGDLDTFQNLVDEVMTHRMGGFAVEPKYGTALANWIDKQPAIRLQAQDADAVARGKQLFESAEQKCTTCHSGVTLTDNLNFDVGTGGSFQVPSLRGVALHAPYMHDGCAKTLEDRFVPSCGGGDAHGETSSLSQAQITDLVAYLKTL